MPQKERLFGLQGAGVQATKSLWSSGRTKEITVRPRFDAPDLQVFCEVNINTLVIGLITDRKHVKVKEEGL